MPQYVSASDWRRKKPRGSLVADFRLIIPAIDIDERQRPDGNMEVVASTLREIPLTKELVEEKLREGMHVDEADRALLRQALEAHPDNQPGQ